MVQGSFFKGEVESIMYPVVFAMIINFTLGLIPLENSKFENSRKKCHLYVSSRVWFRI